MRLRAAAVRLGAPARHRLRYHPALSEAAALYDTVRFVVARTPERRLPRLARALRRTAVPPLRAWLERRLRRWVVGPRAGEWRARKISWDRHRPDLDDPRLTKTIVLKRPGERGEKGVLYASFEVNWLRLLEHCDVARLMEDYLLVGASSWSPPEYEPMLAFAGLGRDPLFVQLSNPADAVRYRVLEPVVRAVPIMACDWVNPEFYVPKPRAERSIDLLMVAGWAPFKGHALLFRALRRMRRGLRVVLIGQDMNGRTADDVLAEARAYGVSDRIEIIRDADPALVTRHQCDSRVSLVLSRREGSSVVTTESFFADTPVVMLRGAHVGARGYVNPATGMLTTPARLARDLGAMLERSDTYAPRRWAVERITCFHASARLNAILHAYARAAGQPWTANIVPMCWRPDPVYVGDADRRAMAPAYAELSERYGLRIHDHGHPLRTADRRLPAQKMA